MSLIDKPGLVGNRVIHGKELGEELDVTMAKILDAVSGMTHCAVGRPLRIASEQPSTVGVCDTYNKMEPT